ncbi:MAG: cyclic-di-AMP receptor [Dehalococcoidia bacterium]
MLDESNPVDKLCFIVVSDTDSGKLSEQMSSKGFASTKIGSSGGFLRRGNVTLITGISSSRLDELMDLIKSICHARKELVPAQTLPFLGEGAFTAEPIEVRAGGAVVFVSNVERFEKF